MLKIFLVCHPVSKYKVLEYSKLLNITEYYVRVNDANENSYSDKS